MSQPSQSRPSMQPHPPREALIERFIRSRGRRLRELLAAPKDEPEFAQVAENGPTYALSRSLPETADDPAQAEMEALVRELAQDVARGAGRTKTGGPRRLTGGRNEALRRGLREVRGELEMLLRPDGAVRQVLTFAFGDKALSWVCGRGPQAQALIRRIEKFAATELPVLIAGETGTGKELAARYIHARSPRAAQPFVAVNCAAIPAELLESQLFGQRAGAFTSAREQPGLIDSARGGTFLLDEISELTLEHQAKLLRFIEEGEYLPVGGRRPRRADVRLLCATNRDLAGLVAQGAFRRDLYHRVNDLVVQLSPLRERPEDLPLFIDFFLLRSAAELGRQVRLNDEARARLLSYPFPGNIRELEKAIRRACILAEGETVQPGDLYLEEEVSGPTEGDLSGVREWLAGARVAHRREVVPRLLDFLRSRGGEWFSSQEWARAAGLSDSQARAQLKALSAEGGPLEHNGEAKGKSRYRLRSA